MQVITGAIYPPSGVAAVVAAQPCGEPGAKMLHDEPGGSGAGGGRGAGPARHGPNWENRVDDARTIRAT